MLQGLAIFPESSVRYMRLWTGYYCRWNARMRSQDVLPKRHRQLLHVKEQFGRKVEALKNELSDSVGGGHRGGHRLSTAPGSSGGGGAAAAAAAAANVPSNSHPAAVMTKFESINI